MELTIENVVLIIASVIAAGIFLLIFAVFHGGAQATQGLINGVITALSRAVGGV